MKTVAELAKDVYKNFGEGISPSDSVKELYESWVVDVISDIFTEHNWAVNDIEETLAVSSGTRLFEFSGDAGLVIRYIKNSSNDKPLESINKAVLQNQTSDITTIGSVRYYYKDVYNVSSGKQKYGLYPVPSEDISISIGYIKSPANYNSDDIIPLPAEFILPIKWGVLKFAYLHEELIETANQYHRMYKEKLQALKLMSHYDPNKQTVIDGSTTMFKRNNTPVIVDGLVVE